MILPLLIAALAAASVAAPPQPRFLQKRSFRASSKGRGLSARQEIARTHRKYGWEIINAQEPLVETSTVVLTVSVTAAAEAAATPTGYSSPVVDSSASSRTSSGASSTSTAKPGTEDGEVIATPEEDESEYLSPVTVGGQKLNLNFDTGSADLWVFSSALSKSDVNGHAIFDPKTSSTWSEYPNGTWSITYGDNSFASGTVGFDTVDVGGSTVKKQCVEIATDVSHQFVDDANSDGLLGLAFSTISTVGPKQQKTFFENVMDDLTHPLFTSDLEESDGKATYEFGIIDSSKHSGEIHYTPVDTSDGWWQFDSPSYAIDGKSSPCTTCAPLIADTGTTLIYLDADIVNAYYKKVNSARDTVYGYSYLCTETLPSLSIAIGDAYVATINGSDMKYASLDDGTGECFGGLQAGPGHIQILGGVFLKQFFAVFDGGNARFGVASKN